MSKNDSNIVTCRACLLTIPPNFPRSVPFDQPAPHNSGCIFPRKAVVKPPEVFDGHQFNAGELEGAGRYQSFESFYGHLVQAPGHLVKTGRPIRLKRGPPTDKRSLAE